MKQILQDLVKGETFIVHAPTPNAEVGQLSINTKVTLISAGTERMLVDFGKASYFEKARQQPEKVKMVVNKVKTNGLLSTLDSVRSKLNQPLPLGYCHVGVVAEVGCQVEGFKIGDRVISNGPHADVVRVPKNLCALIPDNVDDESAVFTVLASIGLQGMRLAAPSLGEAFVVIGVGLIGLLTVQLLRAQGCRVLAVDFNEHKLQLAQQFGAEICSLGKGDDPIVAGMAFSRGLGVDGVMITASTKSNDPIKQAAQMSRKRGRIMLVGLAGLELNRADFYEKELTFQVSCSYGPGRYAPEYENEGLDYPIGFVRWTQQRNFEAVLDMMAMHKLDVKPLISHRYLFEETELAYQVLIKDKDALGILLHYTSDVSTRKIKEINLSENLHFNENKPILGFVGAGNYASRVLIPAFKAANAQFHTIATLSGVSGAIHGKKVGFTRASVDLDLMLGDKAINTFVIVTQHNSHASLVIKVLAAGKHIFVEKPLACNLEELAAVEAAYYTAAMSGKKLHLMVGFNRRIAPHIQKMHALLQQIKEPKSLIMTVNAGAIAADHWTQDNVIGGGRIIGEACHFIDLMRFLVGFEITSIQARRMGESPAIAVTEDKAVITLGFADGSFGTIHYLAYGALAFPKERIEVFSAGRVLQLDNFLKLKGFGWPRFKRMNLWRQDKGQTVCAAAFLRAVECGLDTPIAIKEIFEVARVSIQVAEMLRQQV